MRNQPYLAVALRQGVLRWHLKQSVKDTGERGRPPTTSRRELHRRNLPLHRPRAPRAVLPAPSTQAWVLLDFLKFHAIDDSGSTGGELKHECVWIQNGR